MRYIKSLFLLIACIMHFCLPTYANLEKITYGKTITEDVNVRVDSTTQSVTITLLKKDELVKIVGNNFDWYLIQLPQTIPCYIMKKYVTIEKPNHAKINATTLNIRLSPSLESLIIGKIPKNNLVQITEELDNWLRVDANAYTRGWIHKNLVQEILNQQKEEMPPPQPLPLTEEKVDKTLVVVEQLKKKDNQELDTIRKQILEDGAIIITKFDPYLSSVNTTFIENITPIFIQIVNSDPGLIDMLFANINPSYMNASAVYLDILNNIFTPQTVKTYYFQLAKDKKLTFRKIQSARLALRKKHLIYQKHCQYAKNKVKK